MPAATAELRDFALNGNVGLARSLSDILLERAPYSGDFHSLAGDVAMLEGNSQRALQIYETSARVRRSWPLTRRMIAALEDVRAGTTAAALLSRYIAGDPQNTEALLLLAERSAAQEDWLRVAVLLDTAIALGAGNDLEVLSLRADAANELGQSEEAERFAGLYRELSPGDFISD